MSNDDGNSSVTCSSRGLTAHDLAQLLHTEAPAILDLQRSILDLGIGRLTVDNGGNVSMGHQTAREYLLDRAEFFLWILEKPTVS